MCNGTVKYLQGFLADRLRSAVAPHLRPEVSRFQSALLDAPDWFLLNGGDPALGPLGINVTGPCSVALRSRAHPVGKVQVSASGEEGLLVIDNADWRGQFHAVIRLKGSRCTVAVCGLEGVTANLTDIFLRSAEQVLFWGFGASAVQARIEMEGAGRVLVVGDDALISSGVWIRNHDMHGIHDLKTMSLMNSPCDTIVERHVWLGQDVALMRCPRIGAGSIVAARGLANRSIERTVLVGGLPCRVLKQHISWSRSLTAFSAREHELLNLVRSLPESAPSVVGGN